MFIAVKVDLQGFGEGTVSYDFIKDHAREFGLGYTLLDVVGFDDWKPYFGSDHEGLNRMIDTILTFERLEVDLTKALEYVKRGERLPEEYPHIQTQEELEALPLGSVVKSYTGWDKWVKTTTGFLSFEDGIIENIEANDWAYPYELIVKDGVHMKSEVYT